MGELQEYDAETVVKALNNIKHTIGVHDSLQQDLIYSFKKLKEKVLESEKEIRYLKSQMDNLKKVVDSAEVVIDGTDI